jgi:hypothetical protein
MANLFRTRISGENKYRYCLLLVFVLCCTPVDGIAGQASARQQQQNSKVSFNQAVDIDESLLRTPKIRSTRRLGFVTSGIVCSLSANSSFFVRDPVTGLYSALVGVDDDGNSTIDADTAAAVSTNSSYLNGTVRSLQQPPSLDYVEVRACLCSPLLRRGEEFCPAESNTCYIFGSAPISCYHTSASDYVVRAMWSVAIVSLIVLAYAWYCTSPGKQARQYARRAIRRFHHHRRRRNGDIAAAAEDDADEDEAYLQVLNHLLTHEPERAAYMYRHSVIQERQRQILEEARQDLWMYRMYREFQRLQPVTNTNAGGTTTTSTTTGTEQQQEGEDRENFTEETSADDLHPSATTAIVPQTAVDTRPRLILKTKVYRAAVHGDDASSSCPNPSAIVDVISPTSSSGGGGNSSNYAWSLPTQLPFPFNHHHPRGVGAEHYDTDHVTFEIMDDELEHGTRCAICLIRLRDGDVIGDITCNHCMHKDCLKDWLRRKNRCPLCQENGIAILSQHDDENNAVPPPHVETVQLAI